MTASIALSRRQAAKLKSVLNLSQAAFKIMMLVAVSVLTHTSAAQDIAPRLTQPAVTTHPHETPDDATREPGHSHRRADPMPEGPSGPTATESVLASLCTTGGSACTNGAQSYGNLIAATGGGYFGTASLGGLYDKGAILFIPEGGGTVLQIYSFCPGGGNCTDGSTPFAGVIEDASGNLWGTANQGGNNNRGAIYKLERGIYSVAYSFCQQANCTDGSLPIGGLVLGSDGNFYGMAATGGAYNDGTIYQLTPAGTLTVIHSFCSVAVPATCADGRYPDGGLVQGSDGKLYGSNSSGGAGSSGVVFSLNMDGTDFTILYAFCSATNCTDGANPNYGALTEGPDGNFYGATPYGGTHNKGELFSVSPGGTYTPLYSFCSATACSDGEYPYGEQLTLGSDGNFYGGTSYGGVSNGSSDGGLFQYSSVNGFTELYNFCPAGGACVDGTSALGAMVQNSDGSFLGITQSGGSGDNGGVVYDLALAPALAGPVQVTLPTTGRVGQPVTIGFASSNSFSTTMQQCFVDAENTTTRQSINLGSIAGELSNGIYSGSLVATPPVAGNYTVYVQCGGIETGSASMTVTAPIVTTLILTPTLATGISGQTENFTVNVTAADSSTVNVGTAAVYCNGIGPGIVPISGGTGSIAVDTATQAADTYNCTATYTSPDGDYAPSTASTSVTLTSETTSVALTPASGNLTSGTNVTLTATLSGQHFTPNYGTVTFSADGWSATVPVDYATGTATVSGLLNVPSQTYTVTATYSGARGAQGCSTTQTYAVFP